VNGNGKNRQRKLNYGGTALGLVLSGAVVPYAFAIGGTKIDPSKLAKVEKGDPAKSVAATGKIEPITKGEIKSKASGIVKTLYVRATEITPVESLRYE
jgi:HlyD family secretion protein